MKYSTSIFAIQSKFKLLFCLLCIFFWSLILSSCFDVEMRDSSFDLKYSSVIGQKFKLKENILALGISSNNVLPADYVVLVAGVGFSGPEVVSRNKLPKGTVIEVVKVLTTGSIMSDKVAYVVKEIGSNLLKEKEVRVTLVGRNTDANYGLDGNFINIVD